MQQDNNKLLENFVDNEIVIRVKFMRIKRNFIWYVAETQEKYIEGKKLIK